MTRLLKILFISTAVVATSCSELPEYELPYELSETSAGDLQVNVTATNALCPGPVATFSVDSEADVYYVVALSEDEPFTSQEIWDAGESLSFDAAGSQSIDLEGLDLDGEYTVYAVTVNRDGTRSDEVISTSLNMPSFDDVIAASVGTNFTATTRYGGTPISQFPLTLTSEGDNTFSTEDVWGADFVAILTGEPTYVGAFPYPATLTINSDFTVDVTSEVDLGGEGSFDPCTQSFNVALTTSLFGDPPLAFTVTLEPAAAE